MKRICFLTSFLLFTQISAYTQGYSMFNTNTLFDSFENPAQKAFVGDYFRQYASNFLLPCFNVNAANKGDAGFTINNEINNGVFDTRRLSIGSNERNKFYEQANVYLLTFRMFKHKKNGVELGFSWQVRSDAFADYTNETVVAFRNYNRFASAQSGLFNGTGYEQSYHQLSVNYRASVNEKLAFGIKLSLLSGIVYNKAEISRSSVTVNPMNSQLSFGLTGTYKANFLHDDELGIHTILPNFKNPGLSIGAGATYFMPSGVFLMGNIKDLGVMRWNSNSSLSYINNMITLDRTAAVNSKDLQQRIIELVTDHRVNKSFYTLTNAKADLLISKNYDFYTPNFIVSKNLFYKGGDVAFVNTVKFHECVFSLSPTYNLNGFVLFGTQGMYQTPDFEFFVGTDNLFKSIAMTQRISANHIFNIGASFYMGIAIKFGSLVQNPENSSYMPMGR